METQPQKNMVQDMVEMFNVLEQSIKEMNEINEPSGEQSKDKIDEPSAEMLSSLFAIKEKLAALDRRIAVLELANPH
jgi:hypothetical protein